MVFVSKGLSKYFLVAGLIVTEWFAIWAMPVIWPPYYGGRGGEGSWVAYTIILLVILASVIAGVRLITAGDRIRGAGVSVGLILWSSIWIALGPLQIWFFYAPGITGANIGGAIPTFAVITVPQIVAVWWRLNSGQRMNEPPGSAESDWIV